MLESIHGFRTDLSLRDAEAQVRRLNCALIGQTPEIAPADKRLYALRDVTATVEKRRAIADTLRAVSAELFIPLTVGGGIRTEEDAAAATPEDDRG